MFSYICLSTLLFISAAGPAVEGKPSKPLLRGVTIRVNVHFTLTNYRVDKRLSVSALTAHIYYRQLAVVSINTCALQSSSNLIGQQFDIKRECSKKKDQVLFLCGLWTVPWTVERSICWSKTVLFDKLLTVPFSTTLQSPPEKCLSSSSVKSVQKNM